MRNDVTLGRYQVTFDSGHHTPGGFANPADEKAGIARRLAFCAVLIAAVISADMATSAWGVREQILFALIGILAIVVGLLLWRHRLSDQRLAAERRELIVAVNNIPQGLRSEERRVGKECRSGWQGSD